MAVDTVLMALSDVLPDYELIRDCIQGQRQIKKQGTKYLPDPDEAEPDATERAARYKAYLSRSVFYGVTGRTLRGLVGLVFDKDPAIEIPDLLKPVKEDATGSGTSLDQQAQAALADVVGLGRAGVLTDYPNTAAPTTRADALAGNIRPTVIRYKPEQIINWRTRTVGAKVLLSLVVIRESYVVEDDGFAEKPGTQYRVLRLTPEGIYTVEIHRDTPGQGVITYEAFTPQDGKGQPLREIPFSFIGAEDNDPAVDRPPLLDIAELNIAHYRNSADYEESCFMVGQPTPVLSGLTKQWVDEALKGRVRFGSRAAIPLPVGGKAELLQAEANTMPMEGMKHKEDQMIALGAKLLENSGTQQTATEATQDNVMDNSVLGTCARNVSMAYRKALNWAWLYMTGEVVDDPEVIDYELNTDFAARTLTAQDRQQIVQMWIQNAITWEEMRWNLKRTGSAYEDDEVAKEAIASAKEESIAMEATAAAALADAAGGPPQPGNEDA
jgi:hypothetical protein